MSETPDWYDESKVVRAIYAIEGDKGHSSYGGYVQDLGDGTCRFTNAPMLGEEGPEWGDRVDLFHNPCDPYGRPMVGYRVYPEGVEPTGRNFGLKREPDEEEQDEHEEKEKHREARDLEMIERNCEAMNAPFKIMEAEGKTRDELLRYFELSAWVKEQGLEVPEDLHSKKREVEKEEKTPEKRRESKLFLLALAEREYADVKISDEEVQAEVKKMRREDEQSAAFVKAFAGEDEDEDEDEEGQDS